VPFPARGYGAAGEVAGATRRPARAVARRRRARRGAIARGGRSTSAALASAAAPPGAPPPFSGYRFPPDGIALAVRRSLRSPLGYADAAELLAERGVGVEASTVYAWVRAFATRYEDAARPTRHAAGSSRSVDETPTKVAGKPVEGERASDGHGQVVDGYVRARRAAAGAAACLRRAIASTGVVPGEGTTDGAAAYPSALAAARPPVAPAAGKGCSRASNATTSTAKGGGARRAASRP
jgi:transposase-like protein